MIILMGLTLPLLSQSYLVHQYKETEGLPSSVVFDLIQDPYGRMWFATNRGISCYDGTQWQNFSPPEGLPVPSFWKIRACKDGTIWALAQPGQFELCVAYYNGKRWQTTPSLPPQVNKYRGLSDLEIMESPNPGGNKTVVVATRNMGLLLWQNSDAGWTRITEENGLLSNHVTGLAVMGADLYAATGKGLSVLRGSQVDNRLNEIISRKVQTNSNHNIPVGLSAISIEYKDRFPGSNLKNNRVWLLGDHWLGYLEENKMHICFRDLLWNLAGNEDRFLVVPDYQNGVYISHYVKLTYYNLNTGKFTPIGINNGLVAEGASAVFIDFEKNVWVACMRGVSKISSRRFTSYKRRHGLLRDEVTAIAEISPDSFVFGHYNGLTFFDGSTFKTRVLRKNTTVDLTFLRVLDIKVDSQKKIWIALTNSPLIKTDETGTTTYFGPGEGIAQAVSCVWVDRDPTLDRGVLVGTPNGVLVKRKGARRFVRLGPNQPGNTNVRRIFRISGDTYYIATVHRGVYCYDAMKGTWVNYRYNEITAANNVYAIRKDCRDRLLVGTTAGLFILDNGRLQPFEANGFHIRRPVYFITEDKQCRLWFGSDNGVILWDGAKSIRYSVPQGLAGTETNRAAGLRDRQGRIWIGTNQGVSMYQEQFDNFEKPSPPPKTQLLNLQTANNIIPLVPGEGTIKLPFTENYISINFRSISFLDETETQVKTWLEGFEAGWSDEQYLHKHIIRYPYLPPGQYRFLLKAKNVMGIWSEPLISPTIIIRPPFTRTWVFYIAILLAAAAISASIYRHFSRAKYSRSLASEVTERTRQLRASEEKYAALFRDIKEVVFFSTPDGKITDMNPAGLKLFGIPSKEALRDIVLVRDLYLEKDGRDKFQNTIREKGYVVEFPLKLKRLDGQPLSVLMTAYEERDSNGKLTRYSGLIRDITERKKLEKQLGRAQKMEAIGVLAGGVAHDLNNILTGLTSYPELLLMQIPENDPLRKPILTIKKTGDKAAAMVQDLLTLSRRGVDVRAAIDLNTVVKEYTTSPEFEKLRSHHPLVEFSFDLAPESFGVVASPIHLQKTLMNLVANAAEAISKSGRVTVKTRQCVLEKQVTGYDTVPPGNYIVLRVSDTGSGIPMSDIIHIFEPFYTRKKMGRSGTGLGMSVIWATVKDHNGFIDIQTKVGKGTTFELYFPATAELPAERKAQEPLDRFKGDEKILLVDDVEEQRIVGHKILARLGYHVFTVPSGETALEYVIENPVDLVIIDMIMEEGIGGLETYRRILEIYPDQRAIIVSGFSETSDVEEMHRLGAGEYIRKPYTIRSLGRAVRKELDKE